MKKTKKILTVAIPTYNRPDYLKACLSSVVNQTFKDFEILVLDNCSDTSPKAITKEFNDHRIKLVINKKNIGIIGNWNKAVKLTKTKYLCIFHDDDIMLPNFLFESIKGLEKNPSAAFSYTMANKVNIQGEYISVWSDLYPKVGLIKSPNYLIYTIKKGCCVTIAPTVVYRRKIFSKVGLFNGNLVFNSFDFNFFLRVALKHDIYFIKKILVNYRVHNKQMSQNYWWTREKIKGKTASILEIQNALWKLIETCHKVPKNTKIFLTKCGLSLNKQMAFYLKKIFPDI